MVGLRALVAGACIFSCFFRNVDAFSARRAFPRSSSSPTTSRIVVTKSSNQEQKMSQSLLKMFWNSISAIGMRRVGRFLKQTVPAYRDTIFFFECASVEGCIALTIDDGLSRGGLETSLVPEIIEMLQKHDAHATFFVCTKYTTPEAASDLVAHGHELGNHLGEDLSGFYSKLSRDEFETQLNRANDFLDEIDGGVSSGRWFRAPQGVMTRRMRDVVSQVGLRHALGDVYCDDWAFSNAPSDNSHVAPLMLRQTQSGGSIAILHMPERGFRELSLKALQTFLEGTEEKGLRCMTLSELYQLQIGNTDSLLTTGK